MRHISSATKVGSLAGMGLSLALLLPGCYATDDFSAVENQKLRINTAAETIPGDYIVVFKDSVGVEQTGDYTTRAAQARSKAEAMLADHGVAAAAISRSYGTAIQGFAGRLNDAQVNSLLNDERVKYIEADQVIRLSAPPCHVTDSCDGGGGGDGDEVPYGITRVGGGASYTGSNVAWVIDTGIDLDHEDLNVDVGRSADFTGSGSADDGNGHGTHVAGTIAAKANGLGVVGVAAGAPVVAVRVLDRRGSGTISGVVAGVDYVAANGSNGDVANMSLGGGASSTLDDAVKSCASSGVKMALAAGNESDHANNHSPARAEGNNIFTVSAIDSSDSFASFSNFGNPPIDFAAPGVSVKSTYKGNSYNTLSGTSMAAPHVAGVLLATGGNIKSDGTAKNDPDGNADPIAHQ